MTHDKTGNKLVFVINITLVVPDRRLEMETLCNPQHSSAHHSLMGLQGGNHFVHGVVLSGNKSLGVSIACRSGLYCSLATWGDSKVTFYWPFTWWRHQMETLSALLAICVGNSPGGEFPAQRPETRSFDIFFDLRLNKRLSKQSWGWWFETLSRQLWRHLMHEVLGSV